MKKSGVTHMNETEIAKEVIKDPTSYTWLAYLWVVFLSVWGGVVSYVQKVKNGIIHRFSVTELVGELVTSAFMGVLTFWLCEWARLSPLLTAAFVGVSGHMGSRGLFLLEQALRKRFDNIAG